MPGGFFAEVFFRDDGITTITIPGFTVWMMKFSRTDIALALSEEYVALQGIYVLSGPGEDPSRLMIYVGEGDVAQRIQDHHINKPFWDSAIVATASDGSLNKAHVGALEHLLIVRATKAGRSVLDNRATPTWALRKPTDIAHVNSFFETLLKMFPLLGEHSFD